VFDRFYRGSEARTGEGTGLGLSIVAALVAAHDGRASVHSAPGEGTVFTVELPASDAGPDEAGSPRLGTAEAPLPVTDGVPVPHNAMDHGPRPVRR